MLMAMSRRAFASAAQSSTCSVVRRELSVTAHATAGAQLCMMRSENLRWALYECRVAMPKPALSCKLPDTDRVARL